MKKTKSRNAFKILGIILISSGLLFTACSKESEKEPATEETTSAPAATEAPADDGKGVGPVKSVSLADIDDKLVAEGKAIFETKCTACHKIEAKHVGPALQGVTERRKPEWIMNMIMNPAEMTQKDPVAKKLFAEYLVQMANQNVSEPEARAILEYFRSADKK